MAIRIIQSNFTGGLMSPVLFGRVDLAKYNNSLEDSLNFVLQVHGGAKFRPGTKYIGPLDDLVANATVRCIPFVFSSSQSYVLVFTDHNMRIMKNGGFVVYPVGHASAGQVVEIVSPFGQEHLSKVKYTQITDTMYFAHPSYSRYKLARTDHHVWTFSVVAEVTIAPPAAPVVVGNEAPGGTQRLYTYLVTSVDATGNESVIDWSSGTPATLVSALVTYPWPAAKIVTLTWGAVTGAISYRVYKYAGKEWGLVAETRTVTFTDDNLLPSSTEGMLLPSTKFLTSGDNPGAVGVFEQRAFYSGSTNQPQTVIASQTSLLDNFRTTRFGQDTDSLEFTLFSQLSETIRHFVALDKLLVFTSESEKMLDSGANSDALTPTSFKARTRSKFGCSDIPPIVVGSEVLFVQRERKKILNFYYSLEADGYDSADLTLWNPELLENGVDDWTWDDTTGILWVISAGALYSFTYDKKQQVGAWSKHTTQGTALAIAKINGTSGAEIYLATLRQRIVGGSTETTFNMEILYEGDRSLAQTSFCVDCGLEYIGTAATVFSGLDHLIGREVAVLADGGVIEDLTVSAAGTITLPYAATKVMIGLGYYGILKPVRPGLSIQGSTVQGIFKSVNKLVMRVINTRGLSVSVPNDAGSSVPIETKARSGELFGAPSLLQDGDVPLTLYAPWSRDGQLVINQNYPLPAHITALISEVEFED